MTSYRRTGKTLPSLGGLFKQKCEKLVEGKSHKEKRRLEEAQTKMLHDEMDKSIDGAENDVAA